ncbi:MAG: hypothetical protein LQ347_004288 [Umbilicaria vellea]|nr:MAG: hypothetical protein LQ347_004288 [Umbilicaria vellea]
MALTRELHSPGQFTTATIEELHKHWSQAENKVKAINTLLVFNPTTGTYPSPDFRTQNRLRATQLASLRSSIVVDQDHLFPAEHQTSQTDKSSTMNSCDAPRPIPQPTDIENIARMILTFRRQFHYTWEQIVEFLQTIGFAQTRVGEVKAIFEKYEHNETMGNMHGVYDGGLWDEMLKSAAERGVRLGIIDSGMQHDQPFQRHYDEPFERYMNAPYDM